MLLAVKRKSSAALWFNKRAASNKDYKENLMNKYQDHLHQSDTNII